MRLKNPALHARKLKQKNLDEEKNKNKKEKKKNKTDAFHSFFQSIVPIIHEIWKDR